MIPYATRRLTECPDVADIKREARATHVGRIERDHGYNRRSSVKRATRRRLKRSDKARSLREELRATADEERAILREFEEFWL